MTCTNQLGTVKCYTFQTIQTFSTLINLWKKKNINTLVIIFPLLFNGWYLTRSVWMQIRLNWKKIIPKLSRAIGVLSKTRHYVPSFLLKTTYYSIFNFHLIYTCQVWGQDENCLKKLFSLQNKAIIITLTIRNKLQKTRLSS